MAILTAIFFPLFANAELPSEHTELSETPAEAIPWSEIGAKAGADYEGDGLSITPNGDGAILNSIFQRLRGEATPEGLWLQSTTDEASHDRFRLVAKSFGRTGGEATPLPQVGRVETREKLVSYLRPVDGVRVHGFTNSLVSV